MADKKSICKILAVFAILLALLASGFYGATLQSRNIQPSTIAGSEVNVLSPVSFLGSVFNSSAVYSGNMHVDILFNYTDQAGLSVFLENLSNPLSPQYHKYLTPNEFDSLYSPSRSAYDSAVSYFKGMGATKISTYQNRLLLSVYAPSQVFSEAFHTTISALNSSGSASYAPSSIPELPQQIAGSVYQVLGLSSYSTSFSLNLVNGGLAPVTLDSLSPSTVVPDYPAINTTQSGVQLLYGSYFQVAYNETPLFKSTYATGEVIATLLWGGSYKSNGDVIKTGPYYPSDITTYFDNTMPGSQPKPSVYGVPVDGALPPGPSALYDTSGAALENTLDLEMVGSLAPGASIYNVYGSNSTLQDITDAFNAVLSPGTTYPSALNNVSVISNSWGTSDLYSSDWKLLLEQCQARGITVLASSGDSGNNLSSSKSVSTTESVQFPSTVGYNTFGVLAVGGTNVSINQDYTLKSQQVWYEPATATHNDTLGSVGGISTVYYEEPNWQVNSQANLVLDSKGRGVPDIAAAANNTLVFYSNSTYKNGALFITAGTSVAAPIVAGLIAEMNAYLNKLGEPDIGFMNPSIYKLGTLQYDPSLIGGVVPALAPLYDVTKGHNAEYSALPGYDLVTGMGSINAYNFLVDSIGKRYNVSFVESGLAQGTSWSVSVGGATFNSNGIYVNMSLSNGTYQFEVPVVGNKVAVPVAGSFTVNGANLTIALKFETGYVYNFTEDVLPPGTQWLLKAWNYTKTVSGSYISLFFPNGTFNYSAKPLDPNYYGSSGSFKVNGSGGTINVTFVRGTFTVTFVETGLPYGHPWSVGVLNQTKESTNDTIKFSLLGGSYTFAIPPTGPYVANYTSLDMNTNGLNRTFHLGFSYGYYVTFAASGLPTGAAWSLLVASYNITSSNSSITVELQNGTYQYIANSSSSAYGPVVGNVTVSGHNVTVSINFNPQRTPLEELVLYVVLLALGMVILIVGIALLRKK